MPDMVHSHAYESYSVNPVTSDGKTMQAPVTGTVPRGFLPFPFQATPEDALRAGEELFNPVPPSEEVLARGQHLYEAFCLVCHGETGAGDGPLVPKIPTPPSYRSAALLKMKAGQIYHVITLGKGNMSSYASQVSRRDRWKIVHYVQHLQQTEESQ